MGCLTPAPTTSGFDSIVHSSAALHPFQTSLRHHSSKPICSLEEQNTGKKTVFYAENENLIGVIL